MFNIYKSILTLNRPPLYPLPFSERVAAAAYYTASPLASLHRRLRCPLPTGGRDALSPPAAASSPPSAPPPSLLWRVVAPRRARSASPAPWPSASAASATSSSPFDICLCASVTKVSTPLCRQPQRRARVPISTPLGDKGVNASVPPPDVAIYSTPPAASASPSGWILSSCVESCSVLRLVRSVLHSFHFVISAQATCSILNFGEIFSALIWKGRQRTSRVSITRRRSIRFQNGI